LTPTEKRGNPGNYLVFWRVALAQGMTGGLFTPVRKGASRIAYRKAGDRRKENQLQRFSALSSEF
jgi:hypothetical protein